MIYRRTLIAALTSTLTVIFSVCLNTLTGDSVIGFDESKTDADNTYLNHVETFSDNYDGWFDSYVEPLIETPGQPSVGAIAINGGNNDNLAIRTAFSNGLNGEVSPLIEITNNAENPYNVGINNADDENGVDGYGSSNLENQNRTGDLPI